MDLVAEVKPLELWSAQMVKPCINKVHFAKHMQKMMMTLKNRNMQVTILEINRKNHNPHAE